MPIIIKTKTHTYTRKYDFSNLLANLDSDSFRHRERVELSKPLYCLEFVFNYAHLPADHPLRIRETLEYLAWDNSPMGKEAKRIGWTSDKNKLPPFSNDDIYLPFKLHRDMNSDFMQKVCPHIKSLAPEGNDFTSGNTTRRRGA